MASFMEIKADVRVCFIAHMNQQQLSDQGMDIAIRVNWPEPGRRKDISEETLGELREWFLNIFPYDPDVSPFYPNGQYRYEVSSSGSVEHVFDLKISPILLSGASGPTVFNYHVEVR